MSELISVAVDRTPSRRSFFQASSRSWIISLLLVAAATAVACQREPREIGSVNTEFKILGPSHKIVVESYDDPKIDGITIFISKSQKGGVKGALGLEEQTSDVSVAVRQTGPIKVKASFASGEDALTERRSIIFKHLHVTRFWDGPHQTFVYVAWTDKVLTGSPRSSISAVVAEPWGSQKPDTSIMGPPQGASFATPAG
jgi:CreA protein